MKRCAILLLCVLLAPAFGQTGGFGELPPIRLDQQSIHEYRGCQLIPAGVEFTSCSITLLYPESGVYTVSAQPGYVCVKLTKYIPINPPGARNLKVAEVYLKAQGATVLQYDVTISTGYYALATSTIGSGYVGIAGEMIYHEWPKLWDDDGNVIGYVPQEIATMPAYGLSGCEFLGWSGKALDLGYVDLMGSPVYYSGRLCYTLSVTADFHDAVGEHMYLKALYGMPTPVGTDVVVSLPSNTSVSPGTLGFDEITSPGHIIMEKPASTPNVSSDFRLGQPAIYYDITTTASYSGNIYVSMNYNPSAFNGSPKSLRLLHYEGGRWVDCTTSNDTVNHVISGVVASLSPFAVAERTTIAVDIDIKPGSYPNSFNKNGNGLIPVAILGSDDLDVTQIDPTSLDLAGMSVKVKNNGTPQCSLDDVNADGHPDLVCQFADDSTTWSEGTTTAVLTGNLYDGTLIEGLDEIRIVP